MPVLKINLPYVALEILLVIIGILPALKVNNWNENRKDKTSEQLYFRELLEDLKSDSTVLNDRIFTGIEQHISIAEALLNYMERDSAYSPVELVQRMIQAGFMSFYDANLTTYNELVNSGNLKLIRDKTLKEKMNGYINYNKQIDERHEWNKETIWFDYGNYIREEYLDGRLYGSMYSGMEDALSVYPVDWKKLKKDETLRKK